MLLVLACSELYGYRCQSGVCVRTSTWCDGVVDCPDASDEVQEHCQKQGGSFLVYSEVYELFLNQCKKTE